MFTCCHLYPRFVEGDLHDWQVGRHPSPVPPLVRPWLPHRERPHLDPFLDPQVPQPSRYQQPLSLWDSTFTVAPLPHPQWALLVRITLGQKFCAVYHLSVFCFFVFFNIVCPWLLAGCHNRAVGTYYSLVALGLTYFYDPIIKVYSSCLLSLSRKLSYKHSALWVCCRITAWRKRLLLIFYGSKYIWAINIFIESSLELFMHWYCYC